jgi:arylsulfatase A-like enzyme
MDPHGPYIPPDPFLALFPKERFTERDPIPLLSNDNSGFGGIPSYQQLAVSPPSQDSREYLARYAAEVRFMDHEVGRFMEALKDMGLMRSSVVALTSDHGEALLNDHGYYFSHQNGLTEDQIRVPLVISFSGCNAGEKIKFPVSTIDLFPTALELLRVPPPQDFDGVSLFQKGPRKTISQIVGVTSIREGPWKMLAHDNGGIYLYNLHDDRLETKNLISSRMADAQRLQEALAEILKRPQLAKSVRRKRAGKKTEEALQSLGYVH